MLVSPMDLPIGRRVSNREAEGRKLCVLQAISEVAPDPGDLAFPPPPL